MSYGTLSHYVGEGCIKRQQQPVHECGAHITYEYVTDVPGDIYILVLYISTAASSARRPDDVTACVMPRYTISVFYFPNDASLRPKTLANVVAGTFRLDFFVDANE